jgi:glucokinase
VLGPGTGLGIAHFRRHKGDALIQPTEGSHIDFAPIDEVDDAILAALRKVHDRVSLERVISGEGILAIHAAIAAIEGEDVDEGQEPLAIWQLGMKGDEPISARAVAHFIKTLGRFAGDYALAHGASAVVIAGGLGLRLHEKLKAPEFHDAFVTKGRYRTMMEAMPIKLITHPQPGLLGAAVAYFAQPNLTGHLEGRNS